jgi:hypothetical protein
VVEPGGELPALPPWILEEANQKQAAPFELPPEIYSGERNNTLTRLAGALRRKGIRPDEILETLRAVNRARCRPPLHDSELEQIARSAARWAPGEVETKQATLEDHARPSLLNLAQVQPARVRWLWPGRLPLGKLAILDGLPGVGKSLVQIDIIARVTTGRPMPDGGLPDRAEPGNVVLLTAEDDLADTVVPRLLAAGADLKRVVALRGVLEPDGTERWATLKDLQVLREAVLDTQAVLVAVDPLAAYISARMARDEEVRERLGPLARLAEDAQATVWAIRHLNKQVALTDPILRGGGSIGIIGAARAGLLAAFDPGDPEGERRVLAVTKTNLARRVASLAYRVVEADGVPAVEWLGRSDHTARSLLRAQAEEPEERAALQEAVEFLVEALAQGPRPAEEVLREAQQAGLAERTVRRARAVARVVSRRVGGLGGAGRWVWALPDQAVKEASPGPKVAIHEGFGHLRRVESPELRRDAGLAKTAKLDELGHLSEQPAPPPLAALGPKVAKGEVVGHLSETRFPCGFQPSSPPKMAKGGVDGHLSADPGNPKQVPPSGPGALDRALEAYRAHVEACPGCSWTGGPRCETGHELRRAYHAVWQQALRSGTLTHLPADLARPPALPDLDDLDLVEYRQVHVGPGWTSYQPVVLAEVTPCGWPLPGPRREAGSAGSED